MITFLNKIAKLPSIQNVLLLSHQGEVLFGESSTPSSPVTQQNSAALHTVVASLKKPQTTTLHFKKGFIYLHSTSIGYIVITMQGDKNLTKLKDACLNVAKKLEQKNVAKKVLLTMLGKSDDTLKPELIKALIPHADKDVAVTIINVIANAPRLSEDSKDTILLVACQTLGYCSYFEATSCLKSLLANHTSGKVSLNPYIVEAAQLSIRQLKEINTQEMQAPQQPVVPAPSPQPPPTAGKSKAAPVAPTVPAELKNLPEKGKIESLIAEDKKPAALEVIIDLIKTATQNKEFDKAEALQTWLLQIAPMALTESIKAAELIEESKKALISEEFYSTWHGIVKVLNNDEFIDFYHAMSIKNYPNGEHIVQQGQIRAELMFVNSGRVQLYTQIEGREIGLQMVQDGDLLGHDTFFELSVWTSGAKSLGAEVYSLSFENLQKLEKKFPGIESKMADYCSRLDTSTTLMRKMKRSRRQLERKAISARVSYVLLESETETTGVNGKGDILDISQGGLCFIVHSSKRKNTHQFFGKKILLKINKSHTSAPVERNGKILAVRDHDIIGNAYSVHVQFNTILTGTELREIVAFHRQ
ncbi:cyclic nucleotide-binding domain-containing protein [Desulforhopalus sp. 52FAK]